MSVSVCITKLAINGKATFARFIITSLKHKDSNLYRDGFFCPPILRVSEARSSFVHVQELEVENHISRQTKLYLKIKYPLDISV